MGETEGEGGGAPGQVKLVTSQEDELAPRLRGIDEATYRPTRHGHEGDITRIVRELRGTDDDGLGMFVHENRGAAGRLRHLFDSALPAVIELETRAHEIVRREGASEREQDNARALGLLATTLSQHLEYPNAASERRAAWFHPVRVHEPNRIVTVYKPRYAIEPQLRVYDSRKAPGERRIDTNLNHLDRYDRKGVDAEFIVKDVANPNKPHMVISVFPYRHTDFGDRRGALAGVSTQDARGSLRVDRVHDRDVSGILARTEGAEEEAVEPHIQIRLERSDGGEISIIEGRYLDASQPSAPGISGSEITGRRLLLSPLDFPELQIAVPFISYDTVENDQVGQTLNTNSPLRGLVKDLAGMELKSKNLSVAREIPVKSG